MSESEAQLEAELVSESEAQLEAVDNMNEGKEGVSYVVQIYGL